VGQVGPQRGRFKDWTDARAFMKSTKKYLICLHSKPNQVLQLAMLALVLI